MNMNMKKGKNYSSKQNCELPKEEIQLDGQEIEQVSKLVYLGELIPENENREEEIRRRIEIARKLFSKIHTIMTNPKISI